MKHLSCLWLQALHEATNAFSCLDNMRDTSQLDSRIRKPYILVQKDGHGGFGLLIGGFRGVWPWAQSWECRIHSACCAPLLAAASPTWCSGELITRMDIYRDDRAEIKLQMIVSTKLLWLKKMNMGHSSIFMSFFKFHTAVDNPKISFTTVCRDTRFN